MSSVLLSNFFMICMPYLPILPVIFILHVKNSGFSSLYHCPSGRGGADSAICVQKVEKRNFAAIISLYTAVLRLCWMSMPVVI